MSRIAITGAGGFIGRALVRAARAEGHEVIAITRHKNADSDAGITQIACDLSFPGAKQDLAPVLDGVDAVIHAAASLAGDEASQARDTLAATDHLVGALQGSGVRLVLVSSLSVYDAARLKDGDLLDEDTPLVTRAGDRDTYAVTKAEQEKRARAHDGPVQIVRPGAVYGPDRLWSAQLGFARAGRVICPDGTVPVPAIHVDHAARAMVRAATTDTISDPVNLIDPDPPSQAAWISALDLRCLRVPRPLILAAGRALGRGPGWAARFRPLRYDTRRAQTHLDHRTDRTFAEAMKASRMATAQAE